WAALRLLECDVPASDPAVERAAACLRHVGTDVDERHAPYCLALMILFFDRLGDPADIPLIQALAARLLGGQNAEGIWSYACPPLNTQEVRQLRGTLRRQAELKAKGELPKPAVGAGGRPAL